MMLFKAELPERKQDTSRVGMLTSRSKFFRKLPDWLYEEALVGITAVNGATTKPLFPPMQKYLYAVCDNKPIDTENLKWEAFEGNFVYTNGPARHIRPNTGALKKTHERMRNKKYELIKKRRKRKNKDG